MSFALVGYLLLGWILVGAVVALLLGRVLRESPEAARSAIAAAAFEPLRPAPPAARPRARRHAA
jgi:hypothetical protein